VDLGGPRQIRGSVAAVADSYTVTVTFRPVRVFDPATNEEVNRDLGREYALRVLAKHLSAADEVRFEQSREEVREAKADGERFRVTVRWPRNGVRVAAGAADRDSKARAVSPAVFGGRFFTARQDHLDTLAAVSAGNTAAVNAARDAAAAAPEAERRRVLARGITKAEDRGVAAFDTLAAEVKKDANLLDLTERPELVAAIAAARARFEAELRAALEDPLPAKPSFRDVTIQAPFDRYLTANPLLMDLAGGILVEPGDGTFWLIGVAKTILTDGSPDDLLRAEKVCTLKARAAAIGERDGTRVSYLKRVEDRVIVVKDEAGEKATTVSTRLKVTREAVEGVAKNLPVVGRWRSMDGTIFYLAVGGKLPPNFRSK
jgi:hypothetical protein